MAFLGIHHVQLAMPAGAEARAISFYEGILEVPLVDKPPELEARGGCWFETGLVRIHLGVEQDFRPARKAHPAFEVDDLGELRDRLSRARVDIVEDEGLPGWQRFYASDPFGNRLEFVQPSI